MPTVSPSQSNSGDLITAAAINNPINQLAAVINGGIDAANITDAAVTANKLASSSVTSAKLSLSKSTDANGWTKYDYGTFQKYLKNGSMAVSVSSGAWTAYNVSTNLPIGISSVGSYFVTGSAFASDNALRCTIGALSSDTSIRVSIGNQYAGGTVSGTLYWSAEITTP